MIIANIPVRAVFSLIYGHWLPPRCRHGQAAFLKILGDPIYIKIIFFQQKNQKKITEFFKPFHHLRFSRKLVEVVNCFFAGLFWPAFWAECSLMCFIGRMANTFEIFPFY
jgi:hypothetical protein